MRVPTTLLWTVLAGAVVMWPLVGQAQFRQRHRGDAQPPLHGPAEKIFPFGATWVLRTLGGKAVTAAEPPSFSIDETLRGRGFAGCNTFSMALYPVKNQTLASGAIALTRRLCDAATMELEHRFLVGLHSLPKWDVSAIGDLSLKSSQADMAFRRGI